MAGIIRMQDERSCLGSHFKMFKQKLDFVNYRHYIFTTCTSIIYTKSTNNAISGAVSYGSLHFATNTLKRQYVTVNGGWGYWSNWSSCSKTCDTGSMSRSRSCNNPYPAYGGSYCSGYSSESANCNTNTCPGKAILHINAIKTYSRFDLFYLYSFIKSFNLTGWFFSLGR